jgi:hypothetical protein
LQKPITRKPGGVAQGIDPEFKPQYQKKNYAGKTGFLPAED